MVGACVMYLVVYNAGDSRSRDSFSLPFMLFFLFQPVSCLGAAISLTTHENSSLPFNVSRLNR